MKNFILKKSKLFYPELSDLFFESLNSGAYSLVKKIGSRDCIYDCVDLMPFIVTNVNM